MSSKVVWAIAGSDCSGGAGVQADTKTIHNLGAEACSVITAVTAQNSKGVQSINPVSMDVLSEQLMSLAADKPANVIKIGLLANVDQVKFIAQTIARYKASWETPPLVIYDPVAVASNGDLLTEQDILPTVKSDLLPVVDIITPNNHEMQKLSGVYAFSWSCLSSAANAIQNFGPKAVIIKGGHLDIHVGKCVDVCFDSGVNLAVNSAEPQSYWLSSNTIDTEHTHGTGCTFSSAIAALLAQNYHIRDAFILSKAYINQGLEQSRDYDGLYGPVWQGPWPERAEYFPQVLVDGSPIAQQLEWQNNASKATSFAAGFASVDKQKLSVYPVVDSVEWIENLLKMGIHTLQYREKLLSGDALEQAISDVIALGKTYNAQVFINDHWQLALKHQAYGVHLGQEDLADADLLAIKRAGCRLGISTHGHYEMLKILEYQPSYLAVGAIFPTRTKDMTGQIQGLKTLQDLVKLDKSIAKVAIGGINLERASEVAKTGVDSIAVVTAITEAEQPELAVQQLKELMACR
ncbi:MAG: thiamine phosphate synthase [Gammaproteobacteria bacterium]|nr:thiamine phosphate synthase [Gammaproteobacteria bacterium]